MDGCTDGKLYATGNLRHWKVIMRRRLVHEHVQLERRYAIFSACPVVEIHDQALHLFRLRGKCPGRIQHVAVNQLFE